MLSQIFKKSLIDLKFSASGHAGLLVHRAGDCSAVLKKHNHTCNQCGVRIEGGMEIDHLVSHLPDAPIGDLRPICPFCHGLKHPLWSAMHERYIPILAPEVEQVDLNRFAWSFLAVRDMTECEDACDALYYAIMNRRDSFQSHVGAANMTAFLEALWGLKEEIGVDAAIALAEKLDRSVRFWPVELLSRSETFEAGRRLHTWTHRGFVCVAEEFTKAYRQNVKSSLKDLRGLSEALLEA